MEYNRIDDVEFPPEEEVDYILYNPEWVNSDNPNGTMYGFLSEGEWYLAVWGFNSGKYNTIKGMFVPTHYMPIPHTVYLRQ